MKYIPVIIKNDKGKWISAAVRSDKNGKPNDADMCYYAESNVFKSWILNNFLQHHDIETLKSQLV